MMFVSLLGVKILNLAYAYKSWQEYDSLHSRSTNGWWWFLNCSSTLIKYVLGTFNWYVYPKQVFHRVQTTYFGQRSEQLWAFYQWWSVVLKLESRNVRQWGMDSLPNSCLSSYIIVVGFGWGSKMSANGAGTVHRLISKRGFVFDVEVSGEQWSHGGQSNS